MKSQTNYTKKCPVCDKSQSFKNQYFLNRAIKANTRCKKCCRNQSSVWQTRKRTLRINFTCKFCKKVFTDMESRRRIHCSKECHVKSQTIKNTTKCKRCNTEFVWFGKRQTSRKFCSVGCANNWILCNVKKDTLPERLVAEILDKHNIKYTCQFLIEDKSYDFHIVDTNILIEVDGLYWHGKNVSDDELNSVQKINRHNDLIKNELAKRLNYRLIRIWEDEIIETLPLMLKDLYKL